MCGILVDISKERITDSHPALEIISHRGPDGMGARSFELSDGRWLSLGHRRLSIIDLSERGAQPMSYDDGSLWITFNGEIFNYIELRDELAKEGFDFISDSDTEVLLAAYKHWGTACLDRLNGMFAFAVYDLRKRLLFIARDRFGIKPLYYLSTPEGLRAASELKQFLSIPGFSPEINRLKLYHFLNSGDFAFDDETMWKGVADLQPGHFIQISLDIWHPGDEIKQQKWYEPPFFAERMQISFDDAVCEFRRLLQESVRLRMRADVPVGFLLSGGLDSSTLVGLAHLAFEERNEHLKAYSSCYDDTKIDEREFIEEMIAFSKADSCLHFPKPEDVADNIGNVIWHNDLPILHGSPSVHWLLYRKIKSENDSRKVIIEGQGGDEILCGYGDFHWAALNEMLHSSPLKFISQFSRFQRHHHEPWKIIGRKFFRMNFPSMVKYPPSPLLNTDYLTGSDIPEIAIRREEATVPELHRNRFKIMRYILHNVDRNSMSHSREARVPFLDYRLVEFCLKLPTEMKISEGFSKKILRKAAEQVIPKKIASRTDKQGYSSPLEQWVCKEMKEFFVDGLHKTIDMPFVNSPEIQNLIDKAKAGLPVYNPLLWRLVTTCIWGKIFKAIY